MSHLLDVIPGLQFLQQKYSFLGLLVSLNFVINNKWHLRNFLNAVT